MTELETLPDIRGWCLVSPVQKPGRLSPRERQILELLAKGMAPKEAAAELFISYETVRDYLKQIYQKLHVRSRTEAVLRYLEAGQPPAPPQ